MEPIDPEGRPKVHDPALNHVGLWLDDLRAAVDWLTASGVRFTPGGIRKGAAGFDVCFIHKIDFAVFGIHAEHIIPFVKFQFRMLAHPFREMV